MMSPLQLYISHPLQYTKQTDDILDSLLFYFTVESQHLLSLRTYFSHSSYNFLLDMAPKECTLCHTLRQVLVRCQIDETQQWHFVCPGKCWKSVSGGVEDAKGLEGQYPYYRYGGMVCEALIFILPLPQPHSADSIHQRA